MVKFIGIVLTIIALLFGIFQWYESKEDQKNISNKIEHKIGQDEQARTWLQKEMQFLYQTNYEELKQRYPWGFALVAVDYGKVFIPHESPVRYKFDIYWDTARIIGITDKWIILKFPDFTWSNKVNTYGTTINIARQVGVIWKLFAFGNIGVCLELLIDNTQGFIFLIGFKEIKLNREQYP